MRRFWTRRIIVILGILFIIMFVLAGNANASEPVSDDVKTSQTSFLTPYTIGVGYGIPFGGANSKGLNIEREIDLTTPLSLPIPISIGAILGGGYIGFSKWGADVGLRVHFLSRDFLIRPALSAWYGTQTVLDNQSSDTYETETGFSFGVGIRVNLSSLIGPIGSIDHSLEFTFLKSSMHFNESAYEDKDGWGDDERRYSLGYLLHF